MGLIPTETKLRFDYESGHWAWKKDHSRAVLKERSTGYSPYQTLWTWVMEEVHVGWESIKAQFWIQILGLGKRSKKEALGVGSNRQSELDRKQAGDSKKKDIKEKNNETLVNVNEHVLEGVWKRRRHFACKDDFVSLDPHHLFSMHSFFGYFTLLFSGSTPLIPFSPYNKASRLLFRPSPTNIILSCWRQPNTTQHNATLFLGFEFEVIGLN